jgi:tRNA A-37 threonylcarbamoyl transferase component Bud32
MLLLFHDHHSPFHSDYDSSCSLWAKDVGVVIGKMHDADVVHGDLTTSNIMVRQFCYFLETSRFFFGRNIKYLCVKIF